MSAGAPIKLLPRNAAALRRFEGGTDSVRSVAGNPVSTRLESGVGNCFPGLECDLRNLERRFFPFLAVDIAETAITIVEVDLAAAGQALADGSLAPAFADTLRLIDKDLKRRAPWRIDFIGGSFGPLGKLRVEVAGLTAQAGLPADAWTAIRLLTEGTPITLEISQDEQKATLEGLRQRYLDDNGALASMFVPGELTQSLCSPWTHDFRDCGCFYWASNHPDIATPLSTAGAGADDIAVQDVAWLRQDRERDQAPAPATANKPVELDHYEINLRWQELNFVLEGREHSGRYVAKERKADPYPSLADAEQQLRYAAGVELAVTQMYLSAAYSLRSDLPAGELANDIAAVRAELMRIATGEMHHLRAVNDVLSSFAKDAATPFTPALRVAIKLPGRTNGWTHRAATPAAIADFMDLEAPSKTSVDGLYARILETLEQFGTDAQEQTVRGIIADGEDHFEAFSFVQRWLSDHQPAEYLIAVDLQAPPPAHPAHAELQRAYQLILDNLYNGYVLGFPAGGPNINRARDTMLANNGIAGAAQALAAAGFLVTFDPVADPRFIPIERPAF